MQHFVVRSIVAVAVLMFTPFVLAQAPQFDPHDFSESGNLPGRVSSGTWRQLFSTDGVGKSAIRRQQAGIRSDSRAGRERSHSQGRPDRFPANSIRDLAF